MTGSRSPFLDRPWSGVQRESAAALWAWHGALYEPVAPRLDGDDLAAYFEYESNGFESGSGTKVVAEQVWRQAYVAIDRSSLDVEHFVTQLRASRRFVEPVRFTSHQELAGFADRWVIPHGRLLAALGNVESDWQLEAVDAFTYGFFLIRRLAGLADDLLRDRLFVPWDELISAGVDPTGFTAGVVDESVRKMLWKQAVRARDAFGRALPLARQLPRKQAAAFRFWWLRGLEILNEIERRDFDVWSQPLTLSLYHRAQVVLQARFGRTTFR